MSNGMTVWRSAGRRLARGGTSPGVVDSASTPAMQHELMSLASRPAVDERAR